MLVFRGKGTNKPHYKQKNWAHKPETLLGIGGREYSFLKQKISFLVNRDLNKPKKRPFQKEYEI